MKNITAFLFLIFSLQLFAHTILGTLVLPGSLKTTVTVKNKETSCRVKVEKVKNLLQEDSFGNPAYNVRTNVVLDSINFEKSVWLNNLFIIDEAKSEVRDLEYHSQDDSIKMKIDNQGRIKTVLIRYYGRDISCIF